jgi:hypothetical protein
VSWLLSDTFCADIASCESKTLQNATDEARNELPTNRNILNVTVRVTNIDTEKTLKGL